MEQRMWPADFTSRIMTDRNFGAVERPATYAADHGHALLELAMSWLAAHPAVASVIAGATGPEQVAANAKAASWQLTPEQRDEVTAIAAGGLGFRAWSRLATTKGSWTKTR